jgi:hypothetical protein
MELPPISAPGLSGTAAAIQRGQARFDERAQEVVAAAEAQAAEQPTASDDLTRSLVGMQADAISNQMLYAVFLRQQDQQRELLDSVTPR